jgi:hypothetical protein
MKKLSDYKGEEAIDLWANLLDPLTAIINDKEIATIVKSGEPKINIAKKILKLHKKEAIEILEAVDDTPVDGMNIVIRLVELINEIGQNEDVKAFFGYAEQAKTE